MKIRGVEVDDLTLARVSRRGAGSRSHGSHVIHGMILRLGDRGGRREVELVGQVQIENVTGIKTEGWSFNIAGRGGIVEAEMRIPERVHAVAFGEPQLQNAVLAGKA